MEFVEPSTEVRPGGAPAVTQAPPPPPKIRKRWVALVVVLGLLAGGGAYGVRYYLHSRIWQETDDANIEGHVVPISPRVAGQVVDVLINDNQVVKQGDLLVQIDPRDYEARVLAAKASLAAATAKKAAAQANIRLIETTSTAAVEQQRAGVSVAEAAVVAAETQVVAAKSAFEQAKAQVAAAEAAVSESKAQVVVAESDFTRAESDLKRYDAVRGSAAVSQQQIDLADAAARSAQAKLSAAKEKVTSLTSQVAAARATEQTAAAAIKQAESGLTEAQAKVGEAKAKLASAESAPQQVAISKAQADAAQAEIEAATAQLSTAELQLEYTRITAPQAGRITRKSIEKGAYVQPGQNLFAIVPDKVWVVANFKETQLTKMRAGQEAEVRVDAYPGRVFKGHVDSIQAGTGARFSLLPPENATGNFVKIVQRVPVKIVIDNVDPDHRLSPGMSVIAEVKVK